MAPITKSDLLADLRSHIDRHCATVTDVYRPMDEAALNRQPNAKSWSILQCFEHLNLTHNFYTPKIKAAFTQTVPADPVQDVYRPSFLGWLYMLSAFNPRLSFPAPPVSVPASNLTKTVLDDYLARQDVLRRWFEDVAAVDLRRTRVLLGMGVTFNLGDCLKVLVYHDELHVIQADDVCKSIG